MTKIRKSHQKPYKSRVDLDERLASLETVILYLRDCTLPSDSKRRMLNHAIWEVTIALGNFSPEFRSEAVLNGEVGTRIEREHVFKRKGIVDDILQSEPPIKAIILRIVHCIVTKDEHKNLQNVPESEDGWSRYKKAGINVYRCSGDERTMFAACQKYSE